MTATAIDSATATQTTTAAPTAQPDPAHYILYGNEAESIATGEPIITLCGESFVPGWADTVPNGLENPIMDMCPRCMLLDSFMVR